MMQELTCGSNTFPQSRYTLGGSLGRFCALDHGSIHGNWLVLTAVSPSVVDVQFLWRIPSELPNTAIIHPWTKYGYPGMFQLRADCAVCFGKADMRGEGAFRNGSSAKRKLHYSFWIPKK